MKFRRICASALAVALSLTLIQIGSPGVRAANAHDFGPVTHYNGFIFGDFSSAQADIEGALAVGGNVAMGTFLNQYDVGAAINSRAGSQVIGHYNNDDGYPSLLLSGHDDYNIKLGTRSGGYFNIYGGDIAMSQTLYGSYTGSGNPNRFSIGTVRQVDSDLVKSYFEAAYVRTTKVSGILADNKLMDRAIPLSHFTGYWGNPMPSAVFSDLTNYATTFDAAFDFGGTATDPVLVVNVLGTHVQINEVTLRPSMSSYKFILFNFPEAKTVTFSGGAILLDGAIINTSAKIGQAGNADLKTFAERIVWNFPAATQVGVSAYGVIGSVIAPGAHVAGNGGSINGMLIADSFTTTNGMELHAFPLPELPGDEVGEPDPDPGIGELGWGLLPVPPGSVRLQKVDQNGDPIRTAGASFALYYTPDPNVDPVAGGTLHEDSPFFTDHLGQIAVDDLPWGHYAFKEITPPDGYVLREEPQSFYVAGHNYHTEIQLTFANEPRMFTVAAYKQGENTDGTKQPLAGAVFRLYYVEDWGESDEQLRYIGDYESDANGVLAPQRVIFYDVNTAPFGYYRVYEVASVPGYEIAYGQQYVDIEIKYNPFTDSIVYDFIGPSGSSLVIDTISIEHPADDKERFDVPILPNKQVDDPTVVKHDVAIFKYDSMHGFTLMGAEFTLYEDVANRPAPSPAGAPFTLPIVPDVDSLPPAEVLPPDEDLPPDDTDGEPVPDGGDGDGDDANETTEPLTEDGDGGDDGSHDDATGDGTPDDDVVTSVLGASSQGILSFLSRTSAADGGEGSDDTDGEADPHGDGQIGGDDPAADGGTDSPMAPQGGSGIMPLADATWTQSATHLPAQTDANGMIIFEDLEGGQWYRIEETGRLSNYLQADIGFDMYIPDDPDASVTVRLDPGMEDYVRFRQYGEVIGFMVKNEAECEIVVEKYDSNTIASDGSRIPTADGGYVTPKPLAGAKLKLHRVDASGALSYVAEGETDGSGTLRFTGLLPGEYRVEEVEAPPGYAFVWGMGPPVTVGGSNNSATVLVRNEPTVGHALFRKVDADDTGVGLQGAVFEVHRLEVMADSILWNPLSGTYESGSDGVLRVDGLDTSTLYRLREIDPPSGYESGSGSDSTTLFMADGNIYDVERALEITNTRIATVDPPPVDPPPVDPPPIDPPPTVTPPPPTDTGGGDGDSGTPPPDVTAPPPEPPTDEGTGQTFAPSEGSGSDGGRGISDEDLPYTGFWGEESVVPLVAAVALSTLAIRRWRSRRTT